MIFWTYIRSLIIIIYILVINNNTFVLTIYDHMWLVMVSLNSNGNLFYLCILHIITIILFTILHNSIYVQMDGYIKSLRSSEVF